MSSRTSEYLIRRLRPAFLRFEFPGFMCSTAWQGNRKVCFMILCKIVKHD